MIDEKEIWQLDDQVRYRRLFEEGVLIHQQHAEAIVLSDTGMTFLELCDGRRTTAEIIDEMMQQYDDRLNLPLDLILDAPSDKIIELLTEKVKYMDRHLEKMGDVLNETADLYSAAGDQESAEDLWAKALVIYKHLQETDMSFSMVRMQKITRLNDRLKHSYGD